MPEVHVYVEVDDLDRALEFYVGGLGLHEQRRLTPTWVELAGAQAPIHLLARPEPTFESGDHVLHKDFARHWTPVHLDFAVDDLDTALDRALSAGGTLERTVDYPGLWRMAALADPAGNGVDLIQITEGAYDKLTQT